MSSRILRWPEAILATLIVVIWVGLSMANPAPDASRSGDAAFGALLGIWWAAPSLALGFVARMAGGSHRWALFVAAAALAGCIAVTVQVLYFSPPDGQSALIVLVAPVMGVATGLVALIISVGTRWIRRERQIELPERSDEGRTG